MSRTVGCCRHLSRFEILDLSAPIRCAQSTCLSPEFLRAALRSRENSWIIGKNDYQADISPVYLTGLYTAKPSPDVQSATGNLSPTSSDFPWRSAWHRRGETPPNTTKSELVVILQRQVTGEILAVPRINARGRGVGIWRPTSGSGQLRPGKFTKLASPKTRLSGGVGGNADFRCGARGGLQCGTKPPFALAAIADAASVRTRSTHLCCCDIGNVTEAVVQWRRFGPDRNYTFATA